MHLAQISYKMPNGSYKEVHYWAAKVSDQALGRSNFKPSEEVAQVDWKTPLQALKLLTYEFDQIPLKKLLKHFEAGTLDTKPLIVLRHAKAVARADWRDGKVVDDGRRPLQGFGKEQAKALIPTISAFGPKLVVTSPWKRCKDTVSPYATKKKLKLVERHQLSELGNSKRPRRTSDTIEDIVLKDKSSIVCTHRPSLPTILNTLSAYAPAAIRKEITEAVSLRPGQMLVAHVNRTGKKPRVVAIELQESLLKAE
jgi:8-oxo-dGTP diphosphatase